MKYKKKTCEELKPISIVASESFGNGCKINLATIRLTQTKGLCREYLCLTNSKVFIYNSIFYYPFATYGSTVDYKKYFYLKSYFMDERFSFGPSDKILKFLRKKQSSDVCFLCQLYHS